MHDAIVTMKTEGAFDLVLKLFKLVPAVASKELELLGLTRLFSASRRIILQTKRGTVS